MITWTLDAGVYEVTLARAPCNEIGRELVSDLERFVDEAERSDARVVILHSTLAKGFCAGADLRGLYAAIAEHDPAEHVAELREFLDRIHGLLNRIDMLPQTVIGALHGVCFGGGFELALVCDLLIADRTTRFGFPELRLGLVPGFGGIPRLRRELPNAVVRDLILTGRTLSATRAQALGLVSQLVGNGEALEVARATARHCAQFDRSVIGRAKQFMKPLLHAELEAEKALFLEMFVEPRVKAALADFVARTDPMPYLPARAGGGR